MESIYIKKEKMPAFRSVKAGAFLLVSLLCMAMSFNTMATGPYISRSPIGNVTSACYGTSYTYILNDYGTNTEFNWTVLNGSYTQDGNQVYVTWNATGPWSIKCESCDAGHTNCSVPVSPTTWVTVTVGVNPDVPVFTSVSDFTVCGLEMGTYTITPTYTNVSYTWGASGDASNINNFQTYSNIYWSNVEAFVTVTATVTTTLGCQSSYSHGVQIYDLPSVTVNSPTICASDVYTTITATPSPSIPTHSGTYSYAWTVPGGATNPGNVASFQASVAGTYSVIVTNSATGCSSLSGSGVFTINANPTVSVNSPTVCASALPATITATPSPSGSYTYVWSPSQGNVDHFNTSSAGTYNVTVTDSHSCTGSNSGTLTVNANPTVTVNSPTVCASTLPATITATPSPVGSYTYVWSPSQGNVDHFNTSTAGTYYVTITNNSPGCSGSNSGTLTVHSNPTPVASNDGPVCVGGQFTLHSTTPLVDTWSWSGPNGPVGSTEDVTIYNATLLMAGTYTVTETNIYSCTGTASTDVTVYANPTAAITPDPVTMHAGGSINFDGNPAGGSGTYSTHLWTGTGASYLSFTNIVNPVFSGAPAGSYSLTYTVTDSHGCIGSSSITVLVYGPTIYVNDGVMDGSETWCTAIGNDANPGTAALPLRHINFAIGVAAGGDVIRVDEGTYAENVIINKTLTLTGSNKTNTFIDGSNTGNVVTITAGNVDMSGFTVQNSDYTTPDPVYSGILIDGVDGCNIHGNNLTHNANGIMVQYDAVVGNILDDNVITNNSWNGIYILYSSNVTVTNTTISGMGWGGILLESYVPVQGCVIGSLGNPNTISNIGNYGIGLFGSTTLNSISYNNIQTCGGYGIYATSSISNTFDHNTISNLTSVGIMLIRQDASYTPSSGNTISNNTISYTGNNAIDINDASYNNQITGNTISYCNWPGWSASTAGVDAGEPAWGIAFQNGANNNTITGNDISLSDVGIENWSGGILNVATGNKIYSNFCGVHNNTGVAMDATHNWWGAASGPFHPVTNPCGTGNYVSDYVTYIQFYTNALMTTLSGTSVPVVHNITKGTYYCTIQAAIDDALGTGDDIEVSANTFTENVNVNKWVNLHGLPGATVNPFTPGNSVFTVTANSVSIYGFSVSGANGGGQAGIYIGNGVSLCNIYNNTLTGNFDGIWLGSGSNHNTFTKNTLTGNYQGFELYHSDYNVFGSNDPADANYANSNTQYGFKLESADHNTFTKNTANANNTNGFYLSAGSSNSDNNTLTGNIAISNGVYGIRINSSTGNTLTDNIFSVNGAAGIRLKDNVTNLTLDHNSFTGSPIGIDIASGVGLVTSWTVVHNDLSGDIGFGISNSGTGVLTAINNFWGTAAGPYNAIYNSCGAPSNVSNGVIFTPWWTTSTGVDGSGNLNVYNFTKDTWYCKIQDAVDDADPSGDLIYASAGTYYENVTINKSLTLTGADKATTFIDGSNTGNVVTINTTGGVVITGFTIQNSDYTYPSSGPVYSGVLIDGVNDCNIHGNNLIHNANGIMVQYDGFVNNVLTDNVITNNSWNGIYILASSHVIVTKNTITNMGFSGILLESNVHDCTIGGSALNANTIDGMPVYAIGLFGNTTLNNISYNNILNTGGDPLAGWGWGIYATSSLTNTFNHNTITNCLNVGISLVRQDNSYTPSNGNIISNNIISNTGNNAINVDLASYGNNITGNTITHCNYPYFGSSVPDVDGGNAAWAIAFLRGATNNTATGNTITLSDVGVENWADAGSGNTATGNKIYSNFCGVHNATGVTMNASSNWWGAASGPYRASDNTCGLGNYASDNVTICEWYTDLAMTLLNGCMTSVYNVTGGGSYCA
ncbi:MAG: right-handed parallel beta-helix repeat-containing protein, partial [Bacteroidia bacterium]|nr:right-handed parallel beta-helix repeat-containing protein [Bacteroidia bacterium]